MTHRRILSLWFPRLGAERLIRADPILSDRPFAIVDDRKGAQVLSSLSAAASAAGLVEGQPVRDAHAMCPALVTRLREPPSEAAFLTTLRRWAGKFSPWVAEEAPGGLIVDLTGCAHLFGGEGPLLVQVAQDCADLGMTVRPGIADTPGAAWALARYAGAGAQGSPRSGDAIDQEAWATRSRAAKRRAWDRGGSAAAAPAAGVPEGCVAAPGRTRAALAPLPVAALRLPADTVAQLARLGLRRIEDLWGQPRAALARRFGREIVQRLDQAMGTEPEPVSPARPPAHFAVRLTLPDPIGLEADLAAAIDRLLPRLGALLAEKGHGARRVRLDCHRTDQRTESVEVGLARPSAETDRIRPLLAMKLAGIDAGFGIDRVRLIATQTEPVAPQQHRGHAEAASDAAARLTGIGALDDLMGRIGARIGMDAITRQHPADSHIPEKGVLTLAAAWSEPATDWPRPPVSRPLLMWRPEAVTTLDRPRTTRPDATRREAAAARRDDGTGRAPTACPGPFRWRGRQFDPTETIGPERIAPEWWLDDPDWRSGVRDYWQVTTDRGDRLWLYYAHGGETSAGWFCHGAFA